MRTRTTIRRSAGDKVLTAVCYVIAIAFALCCLIPFIMALSASFTNETALARDGFSLFPTEFSLDAYQMVFKSSQIFQSYGVSLFVTLAGTGLSLLATILLAYPLAIGRLKYGGKINFFVYFTMLFSGGLVPSYMLISRYLHMKDSIWVLIIPILINPWNMFLLRNFFSSIPRELVESGHIDGANDFTIMWRIVLPCATPALATIGLFYYRKDLADKYNITIDSDEKLEEYFKAVKADIDAGTLQMTAPFGVGGTRAFYWLDHDLYEKRASNVFSIDSSAFGIGMDMEAAVSSDGKTVLGVATMGDPDEAYAAFPAPYNKNTRTDRAVNRLTKWAAYTQPDSQTENDAKTNLFFPCKVAATESNIGNYTEYDNAVKALGGELGVYVYNPLMREGKPFVSAPLTAWNFLCVPQQSTKKDQAMKFLDWLFTNSANHDLFELGIEGEDWEAVGEDEYRKLDGSTYSFPGFEMTWNPNFIRTNSDLPDDAKAIVKYGNDPDTYIASPIAGFTFDNTATPELQTAFAAVSVIQTEYQPQIMLGLTKDPAAAQALVDEYYQKAEAAGLETIRQAVQDQLQAFLDAKNS